MGSYEKLPLPFTVTGTPAVGTRVLVYQRPPRGGPRRIFTELDAREGGTFGGNLPPGRYSLRVTGDARPLGRLVDFEIAAGQTVQTLHVPVWPPLSGEPDVRCELEGLDGRVRVALAKPYGLRLEIRLVEPIDEPLSGAVRFVAETRPRPAAA